jgi:lipid-A-disaccharide synthase
VRVVRRRFAQALCIFPFEEAFFGGAGVPTRFIGHPLVGAVQATQTREEFCRRHGLDPGQPIVAILPGSRHAELAQHMPVIREACQRIAEQRPVQFVLAAAAHSNMNELQAGWKAGLDVRVVENQTYNALAAADVAIVSSGTATVEAALLDVPMVVVYRVTPLTALLAKPLVRTSYFSMVNLIAERRVVPELIQKDFTPSKVAEEVLRLLNEPRASEELRAGLAEVRKRLGPPGAVDRAADAIAALLSTVAGNT